MVRTWKGPSAVLTDSHASSGFQYRKQAGLDQAHQRSDPGEDHPPERRPEGAHSPAQNGPRRQAEGKEVSARDCSNVRRAVGKRRVSLPRLQSACFSHSLRNTFSLNAVYV